MKVRTSVSCFRVDVVPVEVRDDGVEARTPPTRRRRERRRDAPSTRRAVAGVRLFGFLKPEDSVMDPHDLHLRENNRLRALSNPLLLNVALLMRGAAPSRSVR